ncbi:T9SS type A sorting domain-containing protein [Melioribacteraceae bacterium 4301-Me]|uniref:T9SS type A sorting domain-containing protein n=1 Tax=Pyranulibacter aquaticus TaxID=3163344 RepID=UPI0035992AB6
MKLKITITMLAALVIFAVPLKAQWNNLGAWPSDAFKGSTHGIAVDPDGKVWVSNYYADTTIVTINGTDTVKSSYRTIKVFNPDGTQASFSPIIFLKKNGVVKDTLKYSTRGMRADNNGNILYVDGFWQMYRINYKTGEEMNKIPENPGDPDLGFAPTSPAVDQNGNIYVAPVLPGNPIKVYDTDFNFIGTAVDATPGYSRTVEVSKDGNTIYFAGYSNGAITVYQRPDEFSPYDSVGTILNGFHCEALAWNPATGYLWASAGSGNDPAEMGYTNNTWYAYDVATGEIKDSLKWIFTTPGSSNERPRGIAFSPDGNIAYISCFGTNDIPLIQKVVHTGNSVRELAELPSGYTLSQNYPNPFNPTTNIKFSIPETGFVTLKVYNTLGQEVATLVNEEKRAGTYEVNFDASNLASGVYMYTLSTNKITLSKKMLLIK